MSLIGQFLAFVRFNIYVMTGSVKINQAYSYVPPNYYYSGEPQRAQIQEDKPFLNLNQVSDDPVAKTGMAAGLLLLLTEAINKLSKVCSDKLMRGQEFTSEVNVKEVANAMKEKANKLGGKVNINVVTDYITPQNKVNYSGFGDAIEQVAQGKNAFFMPDALGAGKGLAVAPQSKPSLMLHELGHAINHAKGGIWKFMQKTRAYTRNAPFALLLLAGMWGGAKTATNRGDKEKNFIADNAGKLGFAAFLPTIIEEGMASIRGIKAAKEKLPGVSLAPLKRNYIFAWLTYVLAGVGLGVAAKQAFLERRG